MGRPVLWHALLLFCQIVLATALHHDAATALLTIRKWAQQRQQSLSKWMASERVVISDQEFQFLNEKTQPYLVKSLPEFELLQLGELYGGDVPIDSSSSLYFMFKPKLGEPVDEVVIWLQGGPGCSSLQGFLTENGPYLWSAGAYKPEINPYAWSNLTNVLWVEYPTGVGFSLGPTNFTDEDQISATFVTWFKNWQNLFEINNYKIYVTGESYGGFYVPYVAQAMIKQSETLHYDVRGALIYDGIIGSIIAQNEIVTYPFLERNQNLLGLNASYMASVKANDTTCGYRDFRDTYLVFPAKGSQPDLHDYPIGGSNPEVSNSSCDLAFNSYAAATDLNPCFNQFAVNEECPAPWDILGTSVYQGPDLPPVYFNRSDVKSAIHAPQQVSWTACVSDVFANGDMSELPIINALPTVIEHTNRVLLTAGTFDAILGTEGLLLAIQNMTWNGMLGYHERPNTPFQISTPDLEYDLGGPQGIMGIQHQERGLLYSATNLATHMGPQSQPRVSLRHLEWLLGRIEQL